jgi:hypothetical protein
VPLKRRWDPAAIFSNGSKPNGWYLDDLVLRPINDLPRADPLIQINTATVTHPYPMGFRGQYCSFP